MDRARLHASCGRPSHCLSRPHAHSGMSRTRLWSPLLGLALLGVGRAYALDLPVRYPDREPLTGPAYRGDALVITLEPAAALAARRALPAGAAESLRPPAEI